MPELLNLTDAESMLSQRIFSRSSDDESIQLTEVVEPSGFEKNQVTRQC
jgi:hypothetical protein